MFRINSFLFILLLIQYSLLAQTDSLQTLTYNEFQQRVLEHHPVARLADLKIEMGKSSVTQSRGGFDPKLDASLSNKYYQQTNYYNLTSAQIKVPTIAAVELKGGVDLNQGNYLNPKEKTPSDGLYYLGASLPLLQGLLMDERRAALRIAQAYNSYTEQERSAILNDLIYSSRIAYWDWWNAAEKVRISLDMLSLAESRFDAIKARALAGDRASIDTVEAYLQKQLRVQQLQETLNTETKTRFILSGFLWNSTDDESTPEALVLSENAQPENILLSNTTGVIDSVKQFFPQFLEKIQITHPLVLQYDWKQKGLKAEEHWKKEKIKPKLNINYNFLSSPTEENGDFAFSSNNYKWGIDFSFPLFMRDARGDLQLQRIKIMETEYQRDIKVVELKNKANTSFQSLIFLERQLNIAENNLMNYQTLLDAERIKFLIGESSVFLINQREISFADARNKVIDLQQKIINTENELLIHLGIIQLDILP